MQCNIDAKGRAVRRRGGILSCLLGVAFACLAFWQPLRAAGLTAGLLMIALGLSQLFEARKGWCAIRAMGFKTPV
jgi:hypothetical protein